SGSSNSSFSFTYHASDGTNTSNTATVTINITNTAPTAIDHSYNVHENSYLSISAANGLLQGAADADTDTLTANVISYPSHGYVMPSGDGSFFYEPTSGYTGADSFTFVAND